MPFSNPIVGGTTLIRPAIHSPDYVQGSDGWSINKDGSAEFNDLTIRSDGSSSTVTISDGVIRITNAAGVDVIEIDSDGYRLYRADGQEVAKITLDGGESLGGFYTRNFKTPANTYSFLSGGQLNLGPVDEILANQHGFLQYNIAPSATPPWASQVLSTGSIDQTLDNPARISLLSERGETPVVTIDGGDVTDTADLVVTGGLSVAGVDQGRGQRAFQNSDTATTPSAFEEIALSQANVSLASGRAYRIKLYGLVRNDAVNGGVRARVRRGATTGGTVWADTFTIATPAANTNVPFYKEVVVKNDSGSTITSTFIMTQDNVSSGNASFNAANTSPFGFEIIDIGDASSFSSARSVT